MRVKSIMLLPMRSDPPHAIVIGGSGGIGMAVVDELSNAGWQVDAPSHAELDITSRDAVISHFEGKTPELLVCAAGVTDDSLIARMAPEQWDYVWNVNYRGALHCAEAVLPSMRCRGVGHIVFLSSHSAIHPPGGQAAYASAKAALLDLNRDLALRCGPENIRVNAILPGYLETRMTSRVSESRRQEVLASHALGRFNNCQVVAGFIRHLHESMPHTSGQVFQLDSRPNFSG